MARTAGAAVIRILVAEDDASLRRLLEMLLTADGYEVRSAEDGAEALSIVQGWLPHVVLTDVMMPRLSGLSLCRTLRAEDRTREVPVILLTARCFDDDIQEVLDLGGVTFMNKPFDAPELTATLRRLASDRNRPATTPPKMRLEGATPPR